MKFASLTLMIISRKGRERNYNETLFLSYLTLNILKIVAPIDKHDASFIVLINI